MIALTLLSGAAAQDLGVKVDQFMLDRAKEMHIPGMAYAIVRDGKIVHQGANGLASIEFNARVTTETPFLLASITKQFTSTAIMKLVEEGKVELDAKIGKYLGEAPEAWSGITVRHLLGHTGGLADRWEEENMSNWRLIYTKSAMYDAAKAKAPIAKPGEKWSYTDQGYFLLGMIIEKASEKSYENFLQETFFESLGMKATRTDDVTAIVPGLASGYTQFQGKWFRNHRRTQYGLTSHYGVISTVGDLAKWAIALQEGKVLKRATISEMWKPVRLGNGDPAWVAHWGYGFGWFLMTFNGHPIVQHGGASGTNLTILPAQKTSVIVLTNLEQAAGGDATGLAEEIYKLYHPELGWTALKAKPDPSGFAAKLKDEIVRLSEGKMDESLYSEAYGKLIKTILPQQKAGLPRFGALDSVDLLFEDKAGKELVSGYRLTFKEVTLYGSVRRNAAGKIEFFAIQGE